MSMWVFQDDNEEYIDYFSLKKLQHETKEYRLNNNLSNPKFNDLSICFNCKVKFTADDIFDFYSDKDNEYCKHQNCNLDTYKYERKNLKLADLQEAICYGGIDYSHDNIIPSNIKRIYLYNTTEELDLSQTQLESIETSGYYPLCSDAFSSVDRLKICNTVVDFTKFTNLITLELSYSTGDIDLSPCNSLQVATMKNIKHNISFENCNKLHTLLLDNISHNINLLGCTKLHSLSIYKSSIQLDLTDCNCIEHLRLENSECNIQPSIVTSLEKLNISNSQHDIDLSSFPNLRTLTFDIFSPSNNKLLNLDKLESLKLFTFNDYKSATYNSSNHSIDISKNTNIEHINIYSANNTCSVNFGTELPKLVKVYLDFNTIYPVYVPNSIKNMQTHRANIIYI